MRKPVKTKLPTIYTYVPCAIDAQEPVGATQTESARCQEVSEEGPAVGVVARPGRFTPSHWRATDGESPQQWLAGSVVREVTIVMGRYENGAFLAFPLHVCELQGVDDDGQTFCINGGDNDHWACKRWVHGEGPTPGKAYVDLIAWARAISRVWVDL